MSLSKFRQSLGEHFPGAMPEAEFLSRTHDALSGLGFEAENTFACVGCCRDEITRSLVDGVCDMWGEAFNFSSLAGMLFLGKTGFEAALQHAPMSEEHVRYVYFALPHIAIDEDGTVGRCWRAGQRDASSACGALIAFRDELASGKPSFGLDMDDVEQSLLKQILIRRITYGEVPELAGLTRHCHDAILEKLEHLIELTVDRTASSYAVVTGIQIHGPLMEQWIWPGSFYAMIEHRKRDLMPLRAD